jgi:hypothetical protein
MNMLGAPKYTVNSLEGKGLVNFEEMMAED